jgi:hypothetical protein
LKITRRSIVNSTLKGSLLCLTFKVGGVATLLTPGQARAQKLPFKVLNEQQVQTLEKLAETIVPGSVDLGVVEFIDHQLNEDPNEALLIAKYFQIPPPYANFYAGGIATVAGVAQKSFGKPVEDLDAEESTQLIREIAPPGTLIDGYPVFLFYMCLRSDAVDVVYGTPAGFARLNVPYMEHILPPEGWNA